MSGDFWLKFFEDKARSKKKLSSFSVNGFVDIQQAKRIRSEVVNIIINYKPFAVVDCGCGDGSVAKCISQYCDSVLGIEISQGMCNLARNKGLDVFNDSTYSLLDRNSELFSSLQILPKKNMMLLFCESLVCMDKPNYLLEQIHNTMPGIQYFLISSPNKDSVFRRILKAPATSQLSYIDFKDLEKTMAQHNYYEAEKRFIITLPGIYTWAIPAALIKSTVFKRVTSMLSNNYIYLFSLQTMTHANRHN